MFGHGGPVFLAITSFMMILFYFAMFIVGITSARQDTFSPSGYRYYLYSLAMLFSHVLASIGGATLSVKINSGLCHQHGNIFLFCSLRAADLLLFPPATLQHLSVEFPVLVQISPRR